MVRGPLKILLFLPALLFGLAVRIRNWLFDLSLLKSESFSVPLISVGNLAVGGTGKTPHTEYLVELLSKQFRVAVLSRGYKRKTKGFLLAGNNPSPLDVGDEPAQIKDRFPGIVVAVDENRRRGIRNIMLAHPETSVIILDDAFQHRRVNPGLSILLTDYGRLFSRDYILPYGRLREHRAGRRRADFILVTKSPLDISAMDRRLVVGEIPPLPHQHLYFTSVVYKEPLPLTEEVKEPICLQKILESKRHILLITGIESPGPLKEYLSNFSENIIHLQYRDHHLFSRQDLEKMTEAFKAMPEGRRCVITTSKDAVRLKEFDGVAAGFDNSIYYLPIGVRLLNNDTEEFNNFITNYVKKNRTDSRVPQEEGDNRT